MKTFDIPSHFRRVTYNEKESKKNDAALTRAMAKLVKQLPGFKADNGKSPRVVFEKGGLRLQLDGSHFSYDYVAVDPGWKYRGRHSKLKRRRFPFPVSLDKLKAHIVEQERLIREADRYDREKDKEREKNLRLTELAQKRFEAFAKRLKYPFDTYGDIVGFDVERDRVRVSLDYLTHEEGMALMALLKPFVVSREKRLKKNDGDGEAA